MTERFERFSFCMLEIYRHWHAIASEEMKPYGLKVPHALYLLTMQHYEDGITAADLSELCGRDKSEVSRSMTDLEKKGMVQKSDTEHGHYRVRLRLTDFGASAAEHLRARARIAVREGGRGISEENRSIFYEALELIAYNLQTMSTEGIPDPPAADEPRT